MSRVIIIKIGCFFLLQEEQSREEQQQQINEARTKKKILRLPENVIFGRPIGGFTGREREQDD
jgi:hypothetical protein|tara:strand:+ start:1328 stop:1516 length:189 start_codon:yes stop_codon:yes gene_type:complete